MTSIALQERQGLEADRGGPLRVAVVGCGAISRRFHLPVLAGHEGIRLVALVDHDRSRAEALAKAYGVPSVLDDASELSSTTVDAALIATPPAHHAPCGIALAGRGLHLLVEKPMTLDEDEAQALNEAAREAGVTLSAGYFRRLFPAVSLLRAALERMALGGLIGFDAEEGDEYGWDLSTLSNLRKDQGGGGVLIDIGSHVLDLLLEVFPGPAEILDYRDNTLGGVETDSALRLRLGHDRRSIEGRVELSRTRKLRNSLRVNCEQGTLELRTGEHAELLIQPRGLSLEDPSRGERRDYTIRAHWSDLPSLPGYEAYRRVIDDWIEAIRTGQPPRLDGDSATRTVRLIAECYRRREPLDEPWVWAGLGGPKANTPRSNPKASVTSQGRRRRRVLITGASGFIGCRLAEILQIGGDWDVRALVHRPSGAARLARLPLEMVQGDLRSTGDVARAVEGCDAVVHCAIGTAYGRRGEIFAVTVGGTRRLIEVAKAAEVSRFVHLSTIAVHGNDVTETIDETTPIRPPRGDDYAESKVEAERLVLKAARAGLPVVVLRPGNVYGPHSRTFTIRPIQYLGRGRLVLAGSAETPSNTVYVDNLAHAIVRALEAEDRVAGEVFTISDGDDLSWGDFYGYFADAMGAELPRMPGGSRPSRVRARGPAAWLASWWRVGGLILKSPEFRAFGRRVLQTDPIGRLPRLLLERYPMLESRLLRGLGSDAVEIYRRPTSDDSDMMEIRPRPATIRVEKARQILGYDPPIKRERALALTLDWLESARLVGSRGSDA